MAILIGLKKAQVTKLLYPGAFVKLFLERINLGGKAYPECEQHHCIGYRPGWTK